MADEPDRKLPVLGGALGALRSGPPSLDEAREALGGPWQGGPDVGEAVELGEGRVGIVVHASPTDRDVWIGEGRIQRVPAARARRVEMPEALRPVGADARIFAALSAGQAVAYEARDGSVGAGTLVEKLRYGGLVGAAGGRVLAVSFRKLTPAATGDAS